MNKQKLTRYFVMFHIFDWVYIFLCGGILVLSAIVFLDGITPVRVGLLISIILSAVGIYFCARHLEDRIMNAYKESGEDDYIYWDKH